ncbi:hypothetical protein [Foetidibacter luteolus]|uniref:hypothetical protein n=1 Tax=Foetidibacter luteolus TaxID=2608880 RepID=UPI001A9A03D6|nr:hypothetical protein [Foetidibacter luteolus]
MKTKTDIDQLIAGLAKTLITREDEFENLAKEQFVPHEPDSLNYLIDKLHNPPPVHPDIDENLLGLGEWLYVCQVVIFELIYLQGVKAMGTLRLVAFGEYDWPQASALTAICRFYVDGKAPLTIIEEIDRNFKTMRYETHLRVAQNLLKRKERDHRYAGLIKQFKSVGFQLAMSELDSSIAMTREELIELGNKIMSSNTDGEDIEQLLELFDKHVPYPNGSTLFYFPENFNAFSDDLTGYNPSVEEIVDKCLNYKRDQA